MPMPPKSPRSGIGLANVLRSPERPPPKGGGFELRLKPDLVGPKGLLALPTLHNFEVVVRDLGLLILDILLHTSSVTLPLVATQ